MGIAVYDMDKTITRRATFTRWLVFWAWREARWRLALIPVAAILAGGYAAGLMSRERLKEASQRLLMGNAAPRAAVARVAAAFAAREVAGGLRPGAVAQLAADRAAGHTIVMATASFAFYARAIADRLGIDHVVATGSDWDGDVLRARIAGDNCYGAAKLAMVAASTGTDRYARAYSDHVSDEPLLSQADVAVAVNPSRGLRWLAAARGWRAADWE